MGADDNQEARPGPEWEDDEVIEPGPDWPGWIKDPALAKMSPEEIEDYIDQDFEQAEREAIEEEERGATPDEGD